MVPFMDPPGRVTHLSKWCIRDFVQRPDSRSFAVLELEYTVDNKVVDLVVLDEARGKA